MKYLLRVLVILVFVQSNAQEDSEFNIEALRKKLLSLSDDFKRGAFKESIQKSNDLIAIYRENNLPIDTILVGANLNKGASYSSLAKIDSSDFYLSKVEKMLGQLNFAYHGFLETVHYCYAKNGRVQGRLNYALEHAILSNDLSNKRLVNGKKDDMWADSKESVALCYYELANFELAVSTLEEALEVRIEIFGETHKKVANTYINLGAIAFKGAKLNKAEKFYLKGMELTNRGENQVGYLAVLANLGVVYLYKNDVERAIDCFKKAIRLVGKGSLQSLKFEQRIAIAYNQMKKYDEAIKKYESILKIYQSKYPNNKVAIMRVMHHLANVNRNIENYDKAFEYSQKSLELKEGLYGVNNRDVILGYYQMGTIYERLAKWEQARKWYKVALNRVLVNKSLKAETEVIRLGLARISMQLDDFNVVANRLKEAEKAIGYDSKRPSDFSKISQAENVSNYLLIKRSLYEQILLKEKDKRYKDSISTVFKEVILLNDYMDQRLFSKSAKSFRIETSLNDEISALDHFYKMQDPVMAFEILEKSKSRQLLQSIKASNLELNSLIPDELGEQQKLLGLKKDSLEQAVYVLRLKKGKEEEVAALENKLVEVNMLKDNQEELLKKEYPNYHLLKNSHNVVALEELQKLLRKDQALIEYFMYKMHVYVLVIKSEGVQFKKLNIGQEEGLKANVEVMRKAIYGQWSKVSTSDKLLKGNRKKYEENAHYIYEKIWAPIADILPEKVIIVADDALHFLPFDALLTNAKDGSSYLVKKHQISYAQSATFYVELIKSKRKNTKRNVLAVAPTFTKNTALEGGLISQRSSLTNLKYNVAEAKKVAALFEGKVFEGELATKSNFIKNATDYKVLHLSTHAKSNDAKGDFSYIAFQNSDSIIDNNVLYVKELYKLKFNAELVVLSACETGLGELNRGEGIIGLSRAFSAAGAKSTITSLWSVNDAQTAVLMTMFYEFLGKGLPKDEALRKAKLKYLEEESLTAPYFWAGFVPSGDMKPVRFNRSKSTSLIIVLGLLIVGAGIVYYDKKKSA